MILINSIICVAEENMNISLLTFNYLDVLNSNDTLIFYGDNSYFMKANESLNNMRKCKIDDNVPFPIKPVKMFINENKYIVFLESGFIGISEDFGKTWQYKSLVNFKILTVIQDNSGNFYIRTTEKILKLNKNYEVITTFNINSSYIIPSYGYYHFNFSKSMTMFKDKIIVTKDSAVVLVLNSDLTENKIIDYKDFLDSTQFYLFGSDLITTSDNFYIYFTVTNKKWLFSKLFKSNLDSAILFRDSLKTMIFNEYNDSLYCFQVDDNAIKDTNLLFYKFPNNANAFITSLNDFKIYNDNVYFIGKNSLIHRYNLNTHSAKNISELIMQPSQYWPPFIKNESEFFLFDYIQPVFHKTSNNGLIYNTESVADFEKDTNFTVYTQFNRWFYNAADTTYYFIGKKNKYNWDTTYVYIFNSHMQVIERKQILGYNPQFPSSTYDYQYNSRNFSNPLEIVNNNNVICVPSEDIYDNNNKIHYNYCYFYNNNWDLLKEYADSNYVVDFVFAKDMNNFLFHRANTIDSGKSEIVYTTDSGENWQILYSYYKEDTLSVIRKVIYEGKNYLFLVHKNNLVRVNNPGVYPTKYYLDVVDLDNFEFHRLREYKNSFPKDIFEYGINIIPAQNNDKLHICINDTLYYIENVLDQSSWKYKVLPKNGQFIAPTTYVNYKFYTRFVNSDNKFYGLDYYEISFSNDNWLSVDEIEKRDYFYSYDLYPNPAHERVTAKIYWDAGLDINSAQIGIYDIYGNQIEARENIEIVQESDWSGKLTWNCAGVPFGSYFIKIDYGTETRVIKFIKI
jgi:hypothetical protein